MSAFERRYLAAVLRRAQGSTGGAARAAGIDRSDFRKLMKHYAMNARRDFSDE